MQDLAFIIVYTYAHPKYYERLGKAQTPGLYVDIVQSYLPAGWAAFRNEMWIETRPPGARRIEQGFKIHISASLGDAKEAIRIAVPMLVEHQTPFKVIADPFFHQFANSKGFPRGSSGKFITIYPTSQESFVALTQDLARATQHLRGPYILSDRRYGDSGVVFYRYGGFRKTSNLRVDGTRQAVIRSSEGTIVSDERLPFFQLPEGIKDPFVNQSDVTDGDGLLHARYRVEEALIFSNVGGVYRATDLHTGLPVVIKEARPHTVLIGGPNLSLDAVEILKRQCRCLELLQTLPCAPRLIESFVEWEHHFLVESFVDGTPLATLRAQESFLIMAHMYNPQALTISCNIWRDIGIRLLQALQSVHDCGIFLGDVSPVNVLRNKNTGELTFVDHESACTSNETGDAALFNASWGLPGFRTTLPESAKSVSKIGDYYACGMLLYNLICPIQSLFDLDKSFPKDSFLKHFCEAGLPLEMADVIHKLWKGDATGALSTLCSFSPSDSITEDKCRSRLMFTHAESHIRNGEDETRNALVNISSELAQTILASADLSRQDRLWPAHALIFETNPLSLAYGACGTALFLKDALGAIPQDICEWILSRKVDPINYPPGLYCGMSGIAWTFALFGWIEIAAEIMRLVPQSPLAFDSPTLFDGTAGWGLSALALFTMTQDDEFLAIAQAAGRHLLESRQTAAEGWYWKSNGDTSSTKLGMGFGSTGISLFLLNLWRATQDIDYLLAAKAAISFEIAHGREREDDGALLWAYSLDSRVYSPYWLRGSGGVASALIRFYQALREDLYLDLARKAAKPCADFFSVAPNTFEGLASMGETLLDMYQTTGEHPYYDAAVLKAHQILLYKLYTQEGVAFPGQWLFRIAHDYGTGGAGIGLFFQRVLTGTPRKFHDLTTIEAGLRTAVAG